MAKYRDDRPENRLHVPMHGKRPQYEIERGTLLALTGDEARKALEVAQPPNLRDPKNVRKLVLMRMEINMRETGHPFHHLTADGTVVDADPTLEVWLSRLTDAAPTVPVNRMFYGFDAEDITYDE